MANTETKPVHTKTSPSPTLGSRLFLAAIGLSLFLIGSLFVGLMGRSFLRAKEMRSWPEVPCVILTSEIGERRHDPDSPEEYRQEISFGYEWKGQAYTSERLSLRGSPWSSRQGEMEARNLDFPIGKAATCHVNPSSPDFAVLKVDSLAPGYSIWFPSLFVLAGLVILFRALTVGTRKRTSKPDNGEIT